MPGSPPTSVCAASSTPDPVLALPAHATIDRIDASAALGVPGRRRGPDRRGPADRHGWQEPDQRAACPQRDPVGRPTGRPRRGRDCRGGSGRRAPRPGRIDDARGRAGPGPRRPARRSPGPLRPADRGGWRVRRVAACRRRWRSREVHAHRAGVGQRRSANRVSARRRRGRTGRMRRGRRGTLRDQLGPPGLPRTSGRHGRAG